MAGTVSLLLLCSIILANGEYPAHPGDHPQAVFDREREQKEYLRAWQIANGSYSGCPGKFIAFFNNFGMHNNQLISLLNAFVLSTEANKTLVVPDFHHMHASHGRGEPPDAFYDMHRFSTQYPCWIMKRHWRPEMGETVRFRSPQFVYWMPSKDRGARKPRPYNLLRPSWRIQQEVDRFKEEFLPEKYTAVHLRVHLSETAPGSRIPNPKKSCERRLRSEPELLPTCRMELPYIREQQAAIGSSTTQKFFVGTDHPAAAPPESVTYKGPLTSDPIGWPVIDFFIMTGSELFLGNTLSSLSVNVCAWLWMNKRKACPNFKFCKNLKKRHPLAPLPCH